MSRIFISYRRQDSPGFAGRICDHVSRRFGDEAVFRDVETLEGGVDFVEAIQTAVGSCAAFILVIGPRWLGAADARGKSRLDNPEDFVRTELASALARQIRVIPVLVEGARMPTAEELPADLRAVTRRQAIEVTDTRFEADIEEVIRALESALGRSTSPIPPAVGSLDVAVTHPSTAVPTTPPRTTAVVVPSHLIWSIASTACLCLPLGIVALVQSTKCNTALASGDIAAAQAASVNARKWNRIASGVGAITWVIYYLAR